MTKLLTTLCALCALCGSTSAQVSNSVQVAWETPLTDATHIVFIGTNSGQYQRSYTFTNTAAWISLDMLERGTNYIAVASRRVTETNAEISELSNEVIVTRRAGPGVRLVIGALSSTNLSAWTPLTNFTIAINATRPAEFFRPAIEMLPAEPDIAEQLPAPPTP